MSYLRIRYLRPHVRVLLVQEIVLATDRRLRGSKYKPREEEEAEMMSTKPPFKARPLR